jgi:hypothetical protein
MSIFNLSSESFELPVPAIEFLCPRTNSSSCQLGRYFLVHGGIDHNRHFINDLWLFDMINLNWNRIKFVIIYAFLFIGAILSLALEVLTVSLIMRGKWKISF